MAESSEDIVSLNEIQSKFTKDVGHKPHTIKQILAYCNQNKIPVKYRDINEWWPTRPDPQIMIKPRQNTACFCGEKVTKYSYNFKDCRGCCKAFKTKQNTFYRCEQKECTYRQLTGFSFMLCKECYDDDDTEIATCDVDGDANVEWMRVKLKRIMSETKKCANNDERRRYMCRVYFKGSKSSRTRKFTQMKFTKVTKYRYRLSFCNKRFLKI
eukprot:831853_1